jgi:hypothetical protein
MPLALNDICSLGPPFDSRSFLIYVLMDPCLEDVTVLFPTSSKANYLCFLASVNSFKG